jgi:BirA family biotin operon repressor/biotin-[acetyl-CoA-carboxylase] ligase
MPDAPASRREPVERDVERRLGATRFTRVRWFVEVDSTNRCALDAARDDEPEGLVVVADLQTAGRGRLGRRWVAPPGASLLASVLVRPDLPVEHLHVLTAASALAAAEAVDTVARVDARLKWPNDLVVGERKLAGVLAETLRSQQGLAVVVGTGVNVDWPSMPGDLAATATALNLVSGAHVDRADLLVAWLEGFDRLLDGLATPGGRAVLRAATLARSATVGRRVRVELTDGMIEGVATGIDDAGRLEVTLDDGSRAVVGVGDVVHLRPAG